MHANEIHAHYDRHNKVSPSPKLSSPNTSKSVANNINILLCLIWRAIDMCISGHKWSNPH